MLGQQGGQLENPGQGQGSLRLRPSSEFHPALRSDAGYLLTMYDKAYGSYMTARNENESALQSLQSRLQTAELRVASLTRDKKELIASGARSLVELKEKETKIANIDRELSSLKRTHASLKSELQTARENRSALEARLEKEAANHFKELEKLQTQLSKLQTTQQINQPGPLEELISLQTRTLKSVGLSGMSNRQSLGLGGLAVALGILGIIGRID